MATPTALPATFVASTVLPASDLNLLRGAFRVLQVVSTSTGTATLNNTVTYADATNLTVSITPTSSDSKVLVLCAVSTGHSAATGGFLRLLRGATVIGTDPMVWFYTGSTNSEYSGVSNSIIYLDSPATTSATAYKIQFRSEGINGVTINRSYNGAAGQTMASSITVFEISA